jgi:hypothetical protein
MSYVPFAERVAALRASLDAQQAKALARQQARRRLLKRRENGRGYLRRQQRVAAQALSVAMGLWRLTAGIEFDGLPTGARDLWHERERLLQRLDDVGEALNRVRLADATWTR